ncbi:MAG TPA: DNA polymerase III subunit gamma/tau [Xanthobacteraceae bacterium]|jgi:DNA polymerase-3 subunit gamma/tau|nr:DNA polymerase III subunit gamma/tau [Xanthobacteraceae bacterium]
MSDAETPDLAAMPGLDLGTASVPARDGQYRVLARKYRPSTFDDLIGQEAMVRTLSNAFETGRIPQAWILTGVRGVGKTTTARILARALNYQQVDGSGGPTITMPTLGVHCQAIMESRHVDVLEMDAASHNGVDDVRQINDAVRYAPVTARYKVYILDEVHMLSGAAFNALLKTLEEPPPHAKFIFATTEIRKVPVTVLSRCQRFDLRRVEAAALVKHLENIVSKEGLTAEPEALAAIARAAEGSVRDSLSLLDQAIAHSGLHGSANSKVGAEDVRQMLGLADRARIIDLFDALMRGDIAAALRELRDQYDSGADPAVVLADLAEFTHFVTRVKVVPSVAEDPSLVEAERTRGRAFAAALSMRVLSRTWQMLFRGIPEVQSAGKPIAAAEMVLVRIAYVADLPTPDEVIRSLRPDQSNAGPVSTGASVSSSAPQPVASAAWGDGPRGGARAALVSSPASALQPASVPKTTPDVATLAVRRFEDLIALAAEKRDLQIKAALESDVRLVRFEDGKLEIALEPGASKLLVNELSRKLSEWTGRRWMVAVSAEQGMPTIRSQAEAQKSERLVGVQNDPLVRAVLSRFPGAKIVEVRHTGAGDLPTGDPDELLPDPDSLNDDM